MTVPAGVARELNARKALRAYMEGGVDVWSVILRYVF